MNDTELSQTELDAIHAHVRTLGNALTAGLRAAGFKKRQNLMQHPGGVTVSDLGNREGLTVIVFTGPANDRTRSIFRATTVAEVDAIIDSLNV